MSSIDVRAAVLMLNMRSGSVVLHHHSTKSTVPGERRGRSRRNIATRLRKTSGDIAPVGRGELELSLLTAPPIESEAFEVRREAGGLLEEVIAEIRKPANLPECERALRWPDRFSCNEAAPGSSIMSSSELVSAESSPLADIANSSLGEACPPAADSGAKLSGDVAGELDSRKDDFAPFQPAVPNTTAAALPEAQH